jgi:SAM-dependent methyltransferase
MSQNFQCNYCSSASFQVACRGIRDWEYGVEGEYAYYQCQGCGGVQLHPFPTLQDLKTAYDIDYHGYAAGENRGLLFSLLYSIKETFFRRQMSRWVSKTSNVLDVGCGAGDFLLSMKTLGVKTLEGIDFSEDMIVSLEKHGIKGFCGTFEEFVGTPDHYQLISMNNYLEHTLDPLAELGKSYVLLESGGHLVGEVPGFDSFERMIAGRYWGGNHVPRHTYQFSGNFLTQLLEKSGFTDIEIKHQLNTSHWALSVQNFFQRNTVNLRKNPRLLHGRSRFYVPLLFLFIPLSLFCVLLKKSGCIKFSARKPPVGECTVAG